MEQSALKKIEVKKEVVVVCISCRKEVKVKMFPYGDGHIASCPVCGDLAYNGV